ncbi:methionyl aminopeptidase [Spirochaetota bacterium]
MRKLSRNDPCWCGSGKKYKKCHLESDLKAGKIPGKAIQPAPGVVIKTEEQIEGIRKSCQLTKKILDKLTKKIKPGITTNDINAWVHKETIKNGATPAPLNYNGFPKSVCTSVNNVICHGIPNDEVLKDGDILNVDVTCIIDGYFGDAGRMYMVGDPPDESRKLIKVAEECLYAGIDKVKPFHDIGEIGYAIEKHANKFGYSVVRDYGGHGIGIHFHEAPHIHHYGSRKRGIYMLPNMVFTIEPMINIGRYTTRLLVDNWTAVTDDGSLSAQWEHTVRVNETGVEILTT